MKKIFWILLSCVLSTGYCFSQTDNSSPGSNNSSDDDVYYNDQNDNPPADASSQDAGTQDGGGAATYDEFYDQLSPYGQWINYPGYGNCWVPNQVPADFNPYVTGGHWIYTEYGWTWVSDYPWGWGPFHYGRWFDDPSYGWLWIPGYDWAPAWVVWGDYGDYYCWAPIGPGAVISAHYRPDARYWHFIPHEHILEGHLDGFVVRPEVAYHGNIGDLNSHINVISHAGTYGQSVYFAGPKAHEVEGFTHTKVERVAVNNSSRPGATTIANNQVSIYRPNISRTDKQPSPKNIARPEDVKVPNRNVTQRPAQQQATERNTPVQQPARQSWTPPRQSAPAPQPARQQSAPQYHYIPAAAPAQHYSAPAPAPHFSAPSAPRSGGGGRR